MPYSRFDVYTSDYIRKYVRGNGQEWEIREPESNLLYGKIPVIYYEVPRSAWADVQSMIDEAENKISVWGDAIGYNSWPILALLGVVDSLPDPGQAGKVIGMENGADAKYLTWDQKPESVTAFLDILFRNIYSLTQTPDLNFEAMKGLGDVSGVAFKRMLIAPHLKAKRVQRGWYGMGIQRRLNLMQAIVKTVEKQYSDIELDIEPTFGLASIDDIRETIDTMLAANGGKPLISQEESIIKTGLTPDAAATLGYIKAEAKEAFDQQQALAAQKNPNTES